MINNFLNYTLKNGLDHTGLSRLMWANIKIVDVHTILLLESWIWTVLAGYIERCSCMISSLNYLRPWDSMRLRWQRFLAHVPEVNNKRESTSYVMLEDFLFHFLDMGGLRSLCLTSLNPTWCISFSCYFCFLPFCCVNCNHECPAMSLMNPSKSTKLRVSLSLSK